jgi:hypothetical protein
VVDYHGLGHRHLLPHRLLMRPQLNGGTLGGPQNLDSGMLVLRPSHLHWLNQDVEDPADLCAHSPVELTIGDVTLVQPGDGDWTVSAAALYLLRTLSSPHTAESRLGDHLFPCCGFTMYDVDEPDVLIVGCLSGMDFDVVRQGGQVRLTSAAGQSHQVPFLEWRDAVCAFADAVHDFYNRSTPRQPSTREDEKGLRTFWREWERRRASAIALSQPPNKPVQQTAARRRVRHRLPLTRGGLRRARSSHRPPSRLLMRPQLNGGTLGGREACRAACATS